MRRADRLFRIVHLLRVRKLATARQLAETLGVSERTVYRDVADLIGSGVPIRGEAGVGYGLDPGFDLPPLMFTADELEALVLGARMVEAWCGPELADAALNVLAKVEHALPRRLRDRVDRTALFVPDVGWTLPGADQMTSLREAIRGRRKVRLAYTDQHGTATDRTVWPLGVFFWGPSATLAAWCELREAFRSFRLDRIRHLEALPDVFGEVPGRTVDDFVRRMRAEEWPERPPT